MSSNDVSEAAPAAQQPTGLTAADLIAHQALLERQAREAIPFSASTCTWSRGAMRQPVFACKTCGGGGVCAGCSVSCHAEHDLVELFAKRNFRCDCGTLSLYRTASNPPAHPVACTLRPGADAVALENEGNSYGRNFEGKFCRCARGETYDPLTEEETMFQCLACEDWFHESCTSLLGGAAPVKPTAVTDLNAAELPSEAASSSTDPAAATTAAIEAPQAEPVPLISHEAFDLLLCDTCVRAPAHQVLRRYVGTPGWGAVLPAAAVGVAATPGAGEWVVKGIEANPELVPGSAVEGEAQASNELAKPAAEATAAAPTSDAAAATAEPDVSTASKRASSPTPDEASSHKRVRTNEGLAVAVNSSAEASSSTAAPASKCTLPPLQPWAAGESTHRLDIFLAEDFREKICRCADCLPLFASLPYILEAEETYTPPRSQPSTPSGASEGGASHCSSSYDLGMAALSRLPREKMLESLEAYGKLRDALFEQVLRPCQEAGRAVDEQAILDFFERQKAEKGRR